MRCNYLIAGLLASTVLSATAFAQTAATPAKPTAPPAAATAPAPATHAGQWRASKLIGVKVYNPQNEKLGDISEILLDQSGKVTGFVIGVGGFLGMGEHNVLASMDQLKFVDEPIPQPTTGIAPSPNRPARETTGAAPNTNTNRLAAARDASPKDRWYPDHAVMNATKDQLKAMTEFKYSSQK